MLASSSVATWTGCGSSSNYPLCAMAFFHSKSRASSIRMEPFTVSFLPRSEFLELSSFHSFQHSHLKLGHSFKSRATSRMLHEPHALTSCKGEAQERKGQTKGRAPPPKNGLIVQSLVPLAYDVFNARITLINNLKKLLKVVPVHACGWCSELHVGPEGHPFKSCKGKHATLRKGLHLWTNAAVEDHRHHLPLRWSTSYVTRAARKSDSDDEQALDISRNRSATVRLIDHNRIWLVGVLSVREAVQMAEDAELDLVIVSPDADPPVVKIMDYSKFRYEQQKKKREQQKKSAANRMNLKQLKMGYNIDQHDYDVRLRAARKFLKDGDKVKVKVNLKGRENQFRNTAIELIRRFQNDVGELATEESKNFRDRNIFISLVPNKDILHISWYVSAWKFTRGFNYETVGRYSQSHFVGKQVVYPSKQKAIECNVYLRKYSHKTSSHDCWIGCQKAKS
ncbi:APO protein [Salix suchowensis]|nr:APO protein [Salix suchowensis]